VQISLPKKLVKNAGKKIIRMRSFAGTAEKRYKVKKR
jgi:hypothetical protein